MPQKQNIIKGIKSFAGFPIRSRDISWEDILREERAPNTIVGEDSTVRVRENYVVRRGLSADLAWAIGSPSLCAPSPLIPRDSWFTREQDAFEANLDALDRQPHDLAQRIGSLRDKRLGAYFEALVAFWLEQHPHYELLGRNIQVVDEGRTLGELDFVFGDGSQVVHLEVALKYYLGLRVHGRCYWVGPAVRDRLDIKLAKLVDKQSSLAMEAACRRQLRAQGLPTPTRSMIMLKGMLFCPAEPPHQHADLSGRPGTSPQWTWTSLQGLELSSLHYWELLEKPNWLAGLHMGPETYLDSANLRAAVQEQWARHLRPLMLVKRTKARPYPEISRHFIVPDGWCERALEMIQSSP